MEELNRFLADSYVLYLKTQNYHWNVTGPHFHSLHEMFEEQYTELAEAIDGIAERIRMLGGKAPGSFSEFSTLKTLPEARDTDATGMVNDLASDNEKMAERSLQLIRTCEESDDYGTADILTARERAHRMAAWMLKSTAAGGEGKPSSPGHTGISSEA